MFWNRAEKLFNYLFFMSLFKCLINFREQIKAFDENLDSLSSRNLPYVIWLALTTIAITGSCLYGASLSLVLPAWKPTGGALWILLSAGLGWFVFGPTLIFVSKKSIFTCAHACMVTMAYGEGVLSLAALVNLIIAFNLPVSFDIGILNFLMVVVSNIVMALVLTLQMQAISVAWYKSLLSWMLALNGSGAIFFWIFQKILQ